MCLKYSLLETRCRPSQRINNTPHKFRISLGERDCRVETVRSTCVAIASEYCKSILHCAGPETAVRMGHTRTSSLLACSCLLNMTSLKLDRAENMNGVNQILVDEDKRLRSNSNQYK